MLKRDLESRKRTQTVSKNKAQRLLENRLPHSDEGEVKQAAWGLPSAESLAIPSRLKTTSSTVLQFLIVSTTYEGHVRLWSIENLNEALQLVKTVKYMF